MTCNNFLEHLTLTWFATDHLGTKNTWKGKVQVTGSQIPILEEENLVHPFLMVIFSLWPAQHLPGNSGMERRGIKATVWSVCLLTGGGVCKIQFYRSGKRSNASATRQQQEESEGNKLHQTWRWSSLTQGAMTHTISRPVWKGFLCETGTINSMLSSLKSGLKVQIWEYLKDQLAMSFSNSSWTIHVSVNNTGNTRFSW